MKFRWLEFLGNIQYTNKPDDVLIQADNLLNLRNWSKEEKLMYDEVTRQQDHYWASLIYAQEEARAKGLAQGIEEGIEQGKLTAIVNLVKEGIISKELGAQKLNLSEQDFET